MSPYKVLAITLGVLLILSATLPNVYAPYHSRAASVKVWTDKSSYTPSDNVVVNVTVQPVKPNEAIAIILLSPDGYGGLEQWTQAKILPDEKGNARHTFSLSKGVPTGTWRVSATYIDAKAEASFSVSKLQVEPAPAPIPSPATIKLWTDKTSYTIGETASIRVQVGPVSKEAVIISIIGSDGRTYFNEKYIPSERGVVEAKFGISRELPTGEWVIVGTYMDAKTRGAFTVLEGKEVSAPPKVTSPTGYAWTSDKKQYKTGDTVFVKGKATAPLSPQSYAWTVIVLDPDEDVYLEKEVKAGSDGSVSFQFELAKDVKPGKWSIQIVTGESIQELQFDVEMVSMQLQGMVVIKNLKKTTLISIKNTGETSISPLLIKVDQGSIQFVKAKDWDRKRIDDKTVGLTSSKGLGPNQFMIVLLKWKDRPELPKEMKIESTSVQEPVALGAGGGPIVMTFSAGHIVIQGWDIAVNKKV